MTEEWYGSLDQTPEAVAARAEQFEQELRAITPELRIEARFLRAGDIITVLSSPGDERRTVRGLWNSNRGAVYITYTDGSRSLLHRSVMIAVWERGDAADPDYRDEELKDWITYLQERNDP